MPQYKMRSGPSFSSVSFFKAGLYCAALTWSLNLFCQDEPYLAFYNGTKLHNLRALKDRVPPFLHLNDLMISLGFAPSQTRDKNIHILVNQRQVILDPAAQTYTYSGITQPLNIRIASGEVYLQTSQVVSLFSQLLGRQMVYEPVSESLHVPAADLFSAKIITRPVDEKYQLEIVYSANAKPPKVDQFNQQLIVKVFEGSVQVDKSAFQANPALERMEMFDRLPDGTTEFLFVLGPGVTKLDIEPFDRRNPRTIVNISGDFGTLSPQDPAAIPAAPLGLRRIVIDPGHGGKDRGAIGPSGLKEKDVTLDLSRRLERALEREGNYEVRLTREGDSSLSLKARTGIANNFNADLFISIHLNAVPTQNARGSETYYLSLDDDNNFDVSHYNTGDSEEDSTEEESDDLELILWDMAQAKHLDDSFRIAKYIQDEFNTLAGIRSRGVKQAPMKVLKGAQMPAVLVEVAFLTDPVEERKLKGAAFREKIIRSLVNAILTYDREVQLRSKGALENEKAGH